jgi:hypothetical protein
MIKSFNPIASLLFVFGLMILLAGVHNIYRIKKFRSAAVLVEGTVINVETKGPYNPPFRYRGRYQAGNPSDGPSTNTYTPVVNFYSADGHQHTDNIGSSSFSTYNPGDKVMLYYNGHDIALAGWDTFLTGIGYLVVGLILMMIKIIYSLKRLKSSHG